jgi:hypothetical protein
MASTAGRATVNAEPATGKTATHAATAAFFAADAAGNAAVAVAGIANATVLA